MTKEQKDFYIELVNKKVHLPCSRCNHTNFSFDGDYLLASNRNPEKFIMSGPAIQCIIITCENCGFVNLYATAALKNNKQIGKIHHYYCGIIFIFLLVLMSIIFYLR